MDRSSLHRLLAEFADKLNTIANSLELEDSNYLYSGPLLENVKTLAFTAFVLPGFFSNRGKPPKECELYPDHCNKCVITKERKQVPTKACTWYSGPDESQYTFIERTQRDYIRKANALLSDLKTGRITDDDVHKLRKIAEGLKQSIPVPTTSNGNGNSKTEDDVNDVCSNVPPEEIESIEDLNQEGEWSIPTSLANLANALGNCGTKKVKTILNSYGLKQAGNRQSWTVRLDQMPDNLREKIENITG